MKHGLLDPASLQRMLYDTLDHSDDFVLVLEQSGDDATDWTIASANDAFCRTTGLTHGELVGRPFRTLIADDADPAWNAFVRAALAEGSFHSELRCSRSNGTKFWFGLHLMRVRESEPPRFVVLGRDITTSLQAKQQQAAIQGLLAKVFLCVKAPVAIVSETGLISMTNPALDEMLGYAPGKLIGKLAVDCNAPSARPAMIAARQRQVEDGKDYSVRTRLLRADGSEVPAEISSITVQREDLRRFRIITALPQPEGPGPPTVIHIAGKIKLVGLDEVKQALGSRWAGVAARAMASAEHVVRKHCGPRDTWSRTADAGFLICYADATEDEASFRAATLAREIRARLIGDGETQAAATVTAIAASVEVPHVPDRTDDMLAAAISERLNSRLAQIEEQARNTLREAAQISTCCLEPVYNRRTHEIAAHFARLPSELENRLLAAYSALPTNERQDFDFDRLVLGVAAEQALSEIAKGGSQLILMNVEFDVFLVRRRTERFVTACQALASRVRERLVLVLSGMPKGFPKSRTLECVTRIRPFCNGVGFQSNNMEIPPVEFSLLGASIVVLQNGKGRIPSPKGSEALGKAIDALHACRARVLVRHVPSWQAAKSLAGLGVDLVSITNDEREPASAAANA
jgi:PAS domain S-box-containing protein